MSLTSLEKNLKNHTVFVANDHAGVDLKNNIMSHLKEMGITVLNLGTNVDQSVDYPDFAHKMALEMQTHLKNNPQEKVFGILICGTGIGMSIAANRHPWIRAVVAESPTKIGLEKLELARRHNNANVLCLGARFLEASEPDILVNTFLGTAFDGDQAGGERHKNRVEKI